MKFIANILYHVNRLSQREREKKVVYAHDMQLDKKIFFL